jgi:hypothetical protein
MEDGQADVTARYEARLEAVRNMAKEAKRKAEAVEREAQAEGMAKFAIKLARLQVQVARVTGLPIVNQELQIFAKSRCSAWPQPSFKSPVVLDT